jgi:glycolate oxidase iron-sulfur subunit
MASKIVQRLSLDSRPILVDSAGCGAAMKDYGRLLGTPEARAVSARVFDIGEWLAQELHRLPLPEPLNLRVAIQDPCHLRHVQRVHEFTRTILKPVVRELVELDDNGICCGAGGAYSLLHKRLARPIRDLKRAALSRAEPDLVASSNPGCAIFLSGNGVEVAHSVEILHAAIHPGCPTGWSAP